MVIFESCIGHAAGTPFYSSNQESSALDDSRTEGIAAGNGAKRPPSNTNPVQRNLRSSSLHASTSSSNLNTSQNGSQNVSTSFEGAQGGPLTVTGLTPNIDSIHLNNSHHNNNYLSSKGAPTAYPSTAPGHGHTSQELSPFNMLIQSADDDLMGVGFTPLINGKRNSSKLLTFTLLMSTILTVFPFVHVFQRWGRRQFLNRFDGFFTLFAFGLFILGMVL